MNSTRVLIVRCEIAVVGFDGTNGASIEQLHWGTARVD